MLPIYKYNIAESLDIELYILNVLKSEAAKYDSRKCTTLFAQLQYLWMDEARK